jgi:hypothetical protein
VHDLARKLTTLCTPCGEVVHVGFEILHDARLASRSDVGTSVVQGECADGRIMCLEDGYKVARLNVNLFQAVNSLLLRGGIRREKD